MAVVIFGGELSGGSPEFLSVTTGDLKEVSYGH
jgi:hypothetical protein